MLNASNKLTNIHLLKLTTLRWQSDLLIKKVGQFDPEWIRNIISPVQYPNIRIR